MKSKEIKEKKDTELIELLNEKRKELRDARFDTAGSKGKDAHIKRKLRKDIARILTEMRERVSAS
ncbi:MAG: 50S ribosomal protein L29 [Candidatus Paceibacterota bacterium]